MLITCVSSLEMNNLSQCRLYDSDSSFRCLRVILRVILWIQRKRDTFQRL